jgi:hypothetical protein
MALGEARKILIDVDEACQFEVFMGMIQKYRRIWADLYM